MADEKRGRKFDDEPKIQDVQTILEENKVKCVNKIIPVSTLIKEYESFEAKRRLHSQYDVFLVENVVSRLVGKKLSSIFMDSSKYPIPIQDFSKSSFDKALSTIAFKQVNEGHVTAIQFGNDTMSSTVLSQNLYSIIDELKAKYPGGWTNIRSLALSCTGTSFQTSYPIYYNLGDSNSVPVPIIITQKEHETKKHIEKLEVDGGIEITKSGKLELKSVMISSIEKEKVKGGKKRPATKQNDTEINNVKKVKSETVDTNSSNTNNKKNKQKKNKK